MEILWIELTECCNLSCGHCCIRHERADAAAQARELDTEFLCRLISDAAKLGCTSLEFTGGEPLLRPDFIEIYSHAYRENLCISIATNITLLSERIADLWEHLPPAKVKVSIYGWNELSYEKVTQNKGAFKRFLEGISRLTDRNISFKSLVPAHPVLLRHASEIREFAAAMGSEMPISLGWELLQHSRRDPLAIERIRNLRISAEEAARQRMRFSELVLDDIRLIRQAQEKGPANDNRLFACMAMEKSLSVDAFGFLQPCRPLRHPGLLYDLKKGSLLHALTTHIPYVRQMQKNNLDNCSQCMLRPACPSCPAASWLENGNLNSPSQYLCDVMHYEAHWTGLLPHGMKGWEWNSRH